MFFWWLFTISTFCNDAVQKSDPNQKQNHWTGRNPMLFLKVKTLPKVTSGRVGMFDIPRKKTCFCGIKTIWTTGEFPPGQWKKTWWKSSNDTSWWKWIVSYGYWIASSFLPTIHGYFLVCGFKPFKNFSQMDHFPKDRGEHKKIFETTN